MKQTAQAAIKLRGSILCLSTFFSTLSAQRLQAASGATSSGAGSPSGGLLQSGAQSASSSLETDPTSGQQQAITTIGSATAATASGLGSGHLRQQDSSSYDTSK